MTVGFGLCEPHDHHEQVYSYSHKRLLFSALPNTSVDGAFGFLDGSFHFTAEPVASAVFVGEGGTRTPL